MSDTCLPRKENLMNLGDRILCGMALYAKGLDEVFVFVPNPDGYIGTHASVRLTDGVDITVRMGFLLPSDFDVSTWSVDVVLVAGGAGDLRRGVATNFGAICTTENYNEVTDSIAAGEVAVLANDLTCIDIIAALTGSDEGDLVGMEFTRYGSHANDTVNADCYFLGVVIRRP